MRVQPTVREREREGEVVEEAGELRLGEWGGSRLYGCEVGGCTVIHHAVIRGTGAPEWPSLFPPESLANGGAALSLFTACSS